MCEKTVCGEVEAPTYDHSSENSVHELAEAADDEIVLASKEHRAVRALRLIVFAVILSMAVLVSVGVFYFTRESENETFENTFTEQGIKMTAAVTANADERITALKALSHQFVTFADYSGASWPNVTLPGFEEQAGFIRRLGNFVAILFLPIVTAETRDGWEAYSQLNQEWLKEGLAIQESKFNISYDEQSAVFGLEKAFQEGDVLGENEEQEIVDDFVIPPVIYKLEGTIPKHELGRGPFAPVWQMAPSIPVPLIVNFNQMSHPTRARELEQLIQSPSLLLSSAADFRDEDPATAHRKAVMNLYLNRWRDGEFEYEDGPVSDLYLPMIVKGKVVGVLTAYVYWQSFFVGVLPNSAEGIVVVLENTCNQTFSYRVDGADSQYLGKGDLHDQTFSHLGVETGFGDFLQQKQIPVTNGTSAQCYYKIKVYPSEETKDGYLTKEPWIFALILVLMFVFTSLIFIAYDIFVSRRHEVVNTTAVQSTRVVSNLFPENVRHRLYDQNKSKKVRNGRADSCESDMSSDHGNDTMEDMPNAHLYHDCTVLFSDIAGFTAWSAQREPWEVFKLLETLFGAFDKVAKRRGVFKIETIGDCYVAVTGLPEPQPDHAIRMALFAGECFVKMNGVLQGLSEGLGSSTSNLSLRSGMHSGSVTAGVLRGEKARFQLFGDTVNTAARMESCGQVGRIQVSQSTAELLQKAGKASWLTKRADVVHAKGKGEMETYWTDPQVESSSRKSSTSTPMLECDGSSSSGTLQHRLPVEGDHSSGGTSAIRDQLTQYLNKGLKGSISSRGE